ncbi:MAG: hypothetical protein RLY57_663 [Candidatus Parcubacteria bacterium]|jgi:putative flippase GtrA
MNTFSRFIKYGVAGGGAFILDFALLYMLLTYTHLHYVFSITIAFIFGTLVNYSINRIYTFNDSEQHIGKGYLYFLIIAAVGIVLTILFVHLLITYLHISVLTSRIIAAGLVYIWSFLANHFLNFKTK